MRRVRAGDAVFSPRLAGFVLDAFSDRPGAAPPARSRAGSAHAAASATSCGCSPAATPTARSRRELFISVKTVETHVSSVLRKTQLSNRYELSRWASDRRLV